MNRVAGRRLHMGCGESLKGQVDDVTVQRSHKGRSIDVVKRVRYQKSKKRRG
jgi:hypothetical protein